MPSPPRLPALLAPAAAAAMLGMSGVAMGAVPAQSGAVDLATQSAATLAGAAAGDWAGASVAGAGDVNGDGVRDALVGAPLASPFGRTNAGTSYLLFGPVTRATIGLGSLGAAGFPMDGAAASGNSGYSVAGAGDVNGDGRPDLVVGAPTNAFGAGRADVVFGGTSTAGIDFAAMGTRGFTITGPPAPASTGWTVAGLGDVNGDGLGDLAVGAPVAGTGPGAAYVVFGSRSGANVDLAALGSRGFAITGTAFSFDELGWSLGPAGDVNGDGYADIIVGSPYAGGVGAGYVVFGGPSGTDVDVATLGARGLVITGASGLGASVSGVGDVNGDGRADIALGAPPAAGGNGRTYVVFGSSASGTLDVSTLAPARGFAVEGAAGDGIGSSVAAAGDVNGDGIDDLATGADGAQGGAGRAYVVYGSRSPGDILLATLAPGTGFRMDAGAAGDTAGRSVAGAGDVTGDARPDLLVGAPGVNANTGATYVVAGFGTPSVAYPLPVTGEAGTAITPVTPKVARTGAATFAVSPALPAGLSLNTGTGVITGTPVAAASGAFTVTMTDQVGTATATEAVSITAAASATPATVPALSVRWAARGNVAWASIARLAGATSYGLVARRGARRTVGRCVVPRASTARVTCVVRLAPGRWRLTALAAASGARLASATHVVTIRAAATPVTG